MILTLSLIHIYNGIVQPISRLDELLEGMIRRIPAQPELMLNELLKAGWVEKEKYYVLLIDVSLGKTKVNDVGELSKRLNARVFSHEKDVYKRQMQISFWFPQCPPCLSVLPILIWPYTGLTFQ